MAGYRRERLDPGPEIQAEKGRRQMHVAEIEGAADERMIDRANLFGEARGGRGVLGPIEHPERAPVPLAQATLPHHAPAAPGRARRDLETTTMRQLHRDGRGAISSELYRTCGVGGAETGVVFGTLLPASVCARRRSSRHPISSSCRSPELLIGGAHWNQPGSAAFHQSKGSVAP